MEKNKSNNVLVTGANGQLGRCIQDASHTEWGDGFHFFFTDIEELDICNVSDIDNFVEQNSIGTIINAAAYTAVDKAEDEIDAAYKLNQEAVKNLAAVCAAHHVYFIHISTDYVFNGECCHPHTEDEVPSPISIYGKSKAAGEQAIKDSGCQASIIRTSWLYSEYGRNFVKTMLKLGSEKERISVVSDQVGGPTYAGDLAVAILKAIRTNKEREGVQLYHFANEGSISWYDFTEAIMEIAQKNCEIKPIFTSEYPAKAPRPPYSVFNLSKIKRELGIEIPYWKDSLKLVISKLDT